MEDEKEAEVLLEPAVVCLTTVGLAFCCSRMGRMQSVCHFAFDRGVPQLGWVLQALSSINDELIVEAAEFGATTPIEGPQGKWHFKLCQKARGDAASNPLPQRVDEFVAATTKRAALAQAARSPITAAAAAPDIGNQARVALDAIEPQQSPSHRVSSVFYPH